MLVRNVLESGTPLCLFKMFDREYSYETRQARSGQIKCSRRAELDLVQNSFRCRAVSLFNSLPEDLRNSRDEQIFKKNVKEWIIKTISI